MKVRGTVWTDIDISEREQVSIAIATICEVFNFKPDYKIEDGEVVEYVEYHTSHSWDEREVIRQASADDLVAFDAIRKIRKWQYRDHK